MSEPVVFYVNRRQYALGKAPALLCALVFIVSALASADQGLHRVGLVFLPIDAIAIVGWALILLYRHPRLILTDRGITWMLPFVFRSWQWSDCVDLSKEETPSGGKIQVELRGGKQFVVPGSYVQLDEVFAAMTLKYEQCKSGG